MACTSPPFSGVIFMGPPGNALSFIARSEAMSSETLIASGPSLTCARWGELRPASEPTFAPSEWSGKKLNAPAPLGLFERLTADARVNPNATEFRHEGESGRLAHGGRRGELHECIRGWEERGRFRHSCATNHAAIRGIDFHDLGGCNAFAIDALGSGLGTLEVPNALDTGRHGGRAG